MSKDSIIDLPLSQVWFVSVDDQDYTHAAIPKAVHASLRFHSKLPCAATIVRVGIGWPQEMLAAHDFNGWYQGCRTTLPLGMEPAEYSRGGPRFGGRVIGTQFVGKMTQSVVHTEAYGQSAVAGGIKHMVFTGGAASDCMGDSAIDTVQSLGIGCTVLTNATADSKDGVRPSFYHRMRDADVGLSRTNKVLTTGDRVLIRRML